MKFVTLNNGLRMPQLGFGVWQIPNEEVTAAVSKALKTGYRSIDTAKVYKNEEGVGKALAESDVDRDKLFVTTKVWNGDQGYEETLAALDESLNKLGLDYVDLYLIHWPMPEVDKYVETYKAMEKLYHEGKVKAIGVCNFNQEHLERLLDECDVVPAVNQVECHPYLQQSDLQDFCNLHNIYLEAWSPLMQGGEVLEHDFIKEIADKYKKTPAQVIIRWHIDSGRIVIPKTVTPSRIEENFNVFDFELDGGDMKRIEEINRNERKGPEPSEMNTQ